jgi:hypothetical protein
MAAPAAAPPLDEAKAKSVLRQVRGPAFVAPAAGFFFCPLFGHFSRRLF